MNEEAGPFETLKAHALISDFTVPRMITKISSVYRPLNLWHFATAATAVKWTQTSPPSPI